MARKVKDMGRRQQQAAMSAITGGGAGTKPISGGGRVSKIDVYDVVRKNIRGVLKNSEYNSLNVYDSGAEMWVGTEDESKQFIIDNLHYDEKPEDVDDGYVSTFAELLNNALDDEDAIVGLFKTEMDRKLHKELFGDDVLISYTPGNHHLVLNK